MYPKEYVIMSILKQLALIPDPRKDINIKHHLLDVIFLFFADVLSGASGWKSIQDFGEAQLDWLKKYGSYHGESPRRHCIAKIINALDTNLLIQSLFLWINERRQRAGKTLLAIDGKTLRRTWSEEICTALHVVSAYDVDAGITLYQKAANNKGKEGELARQSIDALALDNAIVTLDSLHCQTSTSSLITQRKGNFVVQLKATQKKLFEQVKQQFAFAYDSDKLHEYTQTNQGHGRIEKRTVMQINAELPNELKAKWPTIRTFIEVASERTKNNVTHCRSRWYVSSLTLNAEQAAQAIRLHWGIENQLHWVLDVVFREDELLIKAPDGAAHVALFNRVALGVIKQHKGKQDSIASKRRRAAWSADFRSKLIFG